jgi:hypothetical protein
MEYSVTEPKFCSSCGEPNNVVTASKPASGIKPLPRKARPGIPKREVALAEDETDFDYVPDISKLDYTIEIDRSNIKSFQDIVHEQKERG